MATQLLSRSAKPFSVLAVALSFALGVEVRADQVVGAPASKPAASSESSRASRPATTTERRTVPAFDSLPVFASNVPTKLPLPRSIGAKERVHGLYVEAADSFGRAPNPMSRYVQLFASEEDAKSAQSLGFDRTTGTCFQTGVHTADADGPRRPAGSDVPVRWSDSLSGHAVISPYPRTYGPMGPDPKSLIQVLPVMIQRIIDKADDRIELETKVALVDAATTGARLVMQEKAEFVLVKQIPGRISVYAHRGAGEVTFLVRPQRHQAENAPTGHAFVIHQEMSMSGTDGCHLLFKLPVQKNSSTSAVVHLEVVVDVTPVATESHESHGGIKPDGFPRPLQPAEATIRGMQIGIGTSWLSLDSQPVISIGHGWLGRARTQPM